MVVQAAVELHCIHDPAGLVKLFNHLPCRPAAHEPLPFRGRAERPVGRPISWACPDHSQANKSNRTGRLLQVKPRPMQEETNIQ